MKVHEILPQCDSLLANTRLTPSDDMHTALSFTRTDQWEGRMGFIMAQPKQSRSSNSNYRGVGAEESAHVYPAQSSGLLCCLTTNPSPNHNPNPSLNYSPNPHPNLSLNHSPHPIPKPSHNRSPNSSCNLFPSLVLNPALILVLNPVPIIVLIPVLILVLIPFPIVICH